MWAFRSGRRYGQTTMNNEGEGFSVRMHFIISRIWTKIHMNKQITMNDREVFLAGTLQFWLSSVARCRLKLPSKQQLVDSTLKLFVEVVKTSIILFEKCTSLDILTLSTIWSQQVSISFLFVQPTLTKYVFFQNIPLLIRFERVSIHKSLFNVHIHPKFVHVFQGPP